MRVGPQPPRAHAPSARHASRLPASLRSASLVPPHPITSIPIDRAVPATDFMADSSESQFRSGSLIFAMSSTCLRVTVPTLFLFGSADPFARFAARLSSTDAGGVLVMKVYDRSA